MKIQFFMPMIPPTVTAQEHKVTVRNGKPQFYDPPEVKDAKLKLVSALWKYKTYERVSQAVYQQVCRISPSVSPLSWW